MTILAAALLLGLSPVRAQQVQPSPTLAQLQQEAQKDPAAAGTAEDAQNAASQGFSGDASQPQSTAANLPTGKDADGKVYVMVGQSAVKGINIYTPKLDPTGTAITEKPKPADLISKKKVLGAAALGVAAIVGGIMTGGLLGGILLAAGGAFLGIAAVLGFLRHKLNKSKA